MTSTACDCFKNTILIGRRYLIDNTYKELAVRIYKEILQINNEKNSPFKKKNGQEN